jgi:hypothetical protein
VLRPEVVGLPEAWTPAHDYPILQKLHEADLLIGHRTLEDILIRRQDHHYRHTQIEDFGPLMNSGSQKTRVMKIGDFPLRLDGRRPGIDSWNRVRKGMFGTPQSALQALPENLRFGRLVYTRANGVVVDDEPYDAGVVDPQAALAARNQELTREAQQLRDEVVRLLRSGTSSAQDSARIEELMAQIGTRTTERQTLQAERDEHQRLRTAAEEAQAKETARATDLEAQLTVRPTADDLLQLQNEVAQLQEATKQRDKQLADQAEKMRVQEARANQDVGIWTNREQPCHQRLGPTGGSQKKHVDGGRLRQSGSMAKHFLSSFVIGRTSIRSEQSLIVPVLERSRNTDQ